MPARKKFDDEEDSEDTPDDWENEEDSEVEREKAKTKSELTRAGKILAKPLDSR